MSDVGLNSNIYNISNKYLEKVNDLLVEINFNPNSVSKDKIEDVKQVVENLRDENSQNFHIQLILLILEEYFESKKIDLVKSLDVIFISFEEGSFANSEAKKNIELIANALDQECDYAFSRIQA